MYHRIANVERDPWQITVSPEIFEQQIAMLKSTFEIISPGEIARRYQEGNLNTPAVCITFDDTYEDNFHVAASLLRKYECEATFFVPTKNVKQASSFWWDELEYLFLHDAPLPETLELTIRDSEYKFEFSQDAITPEQKRLQDRWVYEDEFATERCQHFYRIWELLRPLTDEEITDQIKQIESWSGRSLIDGGLARAMGVTELSKLASTPGFTIGVHTCTHAALSLHSLEKQQSEIAECKKDLEQLLHLAIPTISYPYGLYNEETLNIARDLHFTTGFTTKPVNVRSSDSPLTLGRFQVYNDSPGILKDQLVRWMN